MLREEKKREKGNGDIADSSSLNIQVKTNFTVRAVHFKLSLSLSPTLYLFLYLSLTLSADSRRCRIIRT